MAQLVGVFRDENYQLRRRQLPLVVDDSLTVSVAYLHNLYFRTQACVIYSKKTGVGNLRKCGMRKVICGTKSAEVGCGTVGNLRNA